MKIRLTQFKLYLDKYWDIAGLYVVILLLALHNLALRQELADWHKHLGIVRQQVLDQEKRTMQLQLDLAAYTNQLKELQVQQAEHRGMLVRQFAVRQGAILTSLGN